MANKLKIIGGTWRSRVISFADLPELRPTPARVRETLFNWLQHELIASRCLDLFAGSGALGFEAASRGANKVIQVEKHPVAYQQLQSNADLLKASQVHAVCADVLQFLAQDSAETFTLVFLDPPFASQLTLPVCQLLAKHHWLAPGALCYVETPAHDNLHGLPDGWQILKQKKAGEVGYHLLSTGN